MLHNTVSHVKQYMTIQNITRHAHVYLMHMTIGESYKDDYHFIYNKDL